MAHTFLWIEVWADYYANYILVLRAFQDGTLEIVDPQRSWSQMGTFSDYEEACHYLSEDEYEPVEGRYLPDE